MGAGAAAGFGGGMGAGAGGETALGAFGVFAHPQPQLFIPPTVPAPMHFGGAPAP